MPTVSDSEVKEAKPQLVTPQAKEPELFAAEIEMEKKSSSFLPLLLIAAFVIIVGGAVYYFYKEATSVLSKQVATASINAILKAQAPASIRFTTGNVTYSANDNPMDPHYKLLAKAGLINTKPISGGISAQLTPAGEKMLEQIAGVKKTENKDKTVTYVVPLARRELASIDNIQMLKPEIAQVTYSWKWEANQLGKQFDASGDLVKSFQVWDRTTLINKYGVDFYQKDPTKVTIKLREADPVWVLFIE